MLRINEQLSWWMELWWVGRWVQTRDRTNRWMEDRWWMTDGQIGCISCGSCVPFSFLLQINDEDQTDTSRYCYQPVAAFKSNTHICSYSNMKDGVLYPFLLCHFGLLCHLLQMDNHQLERRLVLNLRKGAVGQDLELGVSKLTVSCHRE